MQPETISCAPALLRPIDSTDVEAIYRACQDPIVLEWTANLPMPYRREDAIAFVEEVVPAGWADVSSLTWAIETEATPGLVGVVGLQSIRDYSAEAGYWLATAGRGRGLATAALAAVCRFGFDRLGLEAVRWQAIDGNESSRRVAERVGFQISGPVRRLLFQRGVWRDGWIGTLLPKDSPAPAPPRLTDGTVWLRGWRASDAAALPDLIDDEVLRWTGVPGRSREQLAFWLDVSRRVTRPPAARLAITGPDDLPIGAIRLSGDALSGTVNAGWWLGPQARGTGYASRAVRLALGWAAAHGAPRFTAAIFVGNEASRGLAERLGMRYEGLQRGYWPAREPDECRRDAWLYSLVPGDREWPGSAGVSD